MLKIEKEDSLMLLKASDRITQADVENFEPRFDELAVEQGKVPMVIDATELQGYTPEALWGDLRFDSTHRDRIGPMAIITEGGWKEWIAKLSRPFFKEPVRHFDADQLAEAKKWVRSRSPQ